MANKVNKIRIQLNNVVLSFANIFEPKSFNGGEARYSASFLISKQDNVNLNLVKEAIKKVIQLEWPTDIPKFKENMLCLRDGDKETWTGYTGKMFVSSGNKLKVAVKDIDNSDLSASDDKAVSGDVVNAVIEVWAQNNTFGKRINANLVGVQFVKKGERFIKTDTSDDLFGIIGDNKVEDSSVKRIPRFGVRKEEKQQEEEKPQIVTTQEEQDEIDSIFDK